LDERKTKANKPCVLKVAIAHHGVTALISLDAKVLPHQWDSKKLRVINHPDEMLMNLHITHTKQLIDTAILSLAHEGCLDTMKASEVKSRVLDKLKPERVEVRENEEFKATSFAVRFLKFADSKKPSTRGVYMQTYSRLVAFAGEELEKLRFEDITKEWLTKFETFMAQTAPSKNARNIHLRNIRAVFNEAIDDEITTFYPFRRFKIRAVPTRKRSLKLQELRTLFNFHAEPFMQYYLDIFKLNFMLIGINMVDLCRLKEIVDGRVTFHRAKTNRLYSIKVEPEALEIIVVLVVVENVNQPILATMTFNDFQGLWLNLDGIEAIGFGSMERNASIDYLLKPAQVHHIDADEHEIKFENVKVVLHKRLSMKVEQST
jgi:hypothetical protein